MGYEFPEYKTAMILQSGIVVACRAGAFESLETKGESFDCAVMVVVTSR